MTLIIKNNTSEIYQNICKIPLDIFIIIVLSSKYMKNQYNFYNLEASFRKFLLAENILPITVKNYLSDFRHFFGWLIIKIKNQNSKIEVNDEECLKIFTSVNHQLVEDYKDYLTENNIPLKTINRRLSAIRKFFSFCISQGWLKENPAKKISNIKYLPTDRCGQISNKEILHQFEQDLKREITEPQIVKSYLEDIREFLSI